MTQPDAFLQWLADEIAEANDNRFRYIDTQETWDARYHTLQDVYRQYVATRQGEKHAPSNTTPQRVS